MSDRPLTSKDTGLLLQALREQMGTQAPEALSRGFNPDMVRSISRSIMDLPVLPHEKVNLAPLLTLLQSTVADSKLGRVSFRAVGTVQHIGNGVATLSGLPSARTDELVNFPTGVQGLILNLDHDHVDVILLGSDSGIVGGDLVTASGNRLRVPVGVGLLGRIVNPLGQPLDQRGILDVAEYRYLEQRAPGIVERAPISQPLQTGLKVLDALVPIGRGQRELIVGDRQTGKTSIAVDAILNQIADSSISCVYVAIAQKKSSTLEVIEYLARSGALAYTTVVMSSPDDPPALRYLAPYAGCTMAEGLMHSGRDVLIIYDDLTKHADAYRELSLLLRRPPGREAYPGDIFYLHSRLLERACRLSEEMGGGSLTALPIVETQRGNLAGYIPTNLISITDGQIVLDVELFNRGIKPAVNAGRSVSRVGGAAQTKAMRKLSGPLRLELSQYEEVARFARIGAEVDETTRRQIRRGQRLQLALTQAAHEPLSLVEQVIVLLAATEGFFDEVPLEDMVVFEKELLSRIKADHPIMTAQVNRTGDLTDETRVAFLDSIKSFVAQWAKSHAI
ncbi:MAG: F0F1 ATP synthase subunit alpha [Anaerolineae bacterium]|jgi:F-type H+-transporting ATPase subunit alpha|nr:F0F1 ATP synthase subunit alpha [Anaerolineae bacterium]